MHGYTLIELLFTLMIACILSFIGVGAFRDQYSDHLLKQDAKLLAHCLSTARESALLSGQETRVHVEKDRVTVNTAEHLYHTPLSGRNTLQFKRFPAQGSSDVLFTTQGYTNFQNGTFYVTNVNGKTLKLTINQAGRLNLIQNDVH